MQFDTEKWGGHRENVVDVKCVKNQKMFRQLEQFSRLLVSDRVDVLKCGVRHSNVDQLKHGSMRGGGASPSPYSEAKSS